MIWTHLAILAVGICGTFFGVVKWYSDYQTNTIFEDVRKKAAQADALLNLIQAKEAKVKPQLVGILTDFGSGSYYIGNFKGQVAKEYPNARLIDISNDIKPFDVAEGAWTLYNAAKTFPPESIFLAIVNPGGDLRKSRLVITKEPRYYFVGCSESLFDHVVARFQLEKAFVLATNNDDDTFGIQTFVPVIWALLGGSSTEDLKTKNLVGHELDYYTKSLKSSTGEAEFKDGEAHGYVCATDRWGNLQSNIPQHGFFVLGRAYTVTIEAGGGPSTKRASLTDCVFGSSYSEGIGHGGVLVRQDGWIQVAIYRHSAKDYFEQALAERPPSPEGLKLPAAAESVDITNCVVVIEPD